MKIKSRDPKAFFLEGDQRGLLLIHGFTGSAAELGPMGQYFHQKGLTVHAPLLAGHGTSPEEMAETDWTDWWQSAVDGYEKLRNFGCTRVYVAGLSMGGVLALRIARQFPVDGVISMAAPMKIKDKKAYFAKYLYRFYPFIGRGEPKAPHIEEHIVPYDRTPVKSVVGLQYLIKDVRNSLAKITTPAFIVQGGEDETIDPNDAYLIESNLGSTDKTLKWYPKSSHIIVLDVEREQMFGDIDNFIQRLEKELEQRDV